MTNKVLRLENRLMWRSSESVNWPFDEFHTRWAFWPYSALCRSVSCR